MQISKDNADSLEKAKSEANVKISKLNQKIVLEKAEIDAKRQEQSRNLKSKFRLKEYQLNTSVLQAGEREQVWQDERAEVLREVQRLKAEASKMVNILAMEYEEENLSEDQKRSLSQEVYSLQLVVEMRTGEVNN